MALKGITSGSRRMIALAALALGTAGGCGPVGKMSLPGGPLVKGREKEIQKIAGDPMAFLRQALEVSRHLKHYSMDFERQERLGFVKQLRPTEHIFAEYRDDPFSVRFTWKDADSEYAQCVYVDGKHGNKVVLLPRKGPLGTPPAPLAYPANWAMLFQKARNPITDFGPRRMMERILDRIDKAGKHGDVEIAVLEPKWIGPAREPCYHLELRYPRGDPYACKLQDLYIHMDKLWPVATWLWIPGKKERSEATLDAMYLYASLNPQARVTDDCFVLDHKPGERPAKPDAVTAGELRPAEATRAGE